MKTIGDYEYQQEFSGRFYLKRIVKQVPDNELYPDSVVLTTQDQINDWLDWITVDKFWEKIWA